MGEYEAHSKRMRTTICQAMIRLLEEKPFSKITVRDIMGTAEIQRATFYRYFRDKYEVAEMINRNLADFLSRDYFRAFYRGQGIDIQSQLTFDTQYRRVLRKLIRLRIESVDLQQNLLDAFRREYTAYFPDCSEFESYLAAENFLSVINWLTERDAPVSVIGGSLLSETYVRFSARFCGIDPEALEEFVQKNRGEPNE